MFPLFFEQLNDWKNKIYFYKNYDLLIIINLLTNRSFKDLYQYPVFPILYKPFKIIEDKERDLSAHIGFQELNEKTKKRKKLIEESYNSSMTEIDEQNDEININIRCLFNSHYSTLIYTFNKNISL